MTEQSGHIVLNHLIRTCRDSARGFSHAATQVRSMPLKELFLELATQRASFAEELVPHAQRLGGDRPADGTVAAAVHRRWMELRGALSAHDDHAVAAEVERGDAHTLAAYREAIGASLMPATRDVVERQFAEVEEGHARLRARERARLVSR